MIVIIYSCYFEAEWKRDMAKIAKQMKFADRIKALKVCVIFVVVKDCYFEFHNVTALLK